QPLLRLLPRGRRLRRPRLQHLLGVAGQPGAPPGAALSGLPHGPHGPPDQPGPRPRRHRPRPGHARRPPPLPGQPGRHVTLPAPCWRADLEPADTRLTPGRVDRSAYLFPAGTVRLRVRVLYRRFWREVARSKGWPDRDLAVFDRTFAAPR